MYVLGIETSCDETSCAVVRDGRKVISNIVASSLKFHQKYGGVIPEIASRMQLEEIAKVADAAIKEARLKLKDLDLIGVTASPGLLGSLLVGLSFGKAVGLALNIPVREVDHVHSHFYANFLNGKGVRFPFIALVASGGHTSLFYVEDFKRTKALGQTQDDACGEAFDKVAKILGLGYPGGPLIEKLAKKGEAQKIKFSCSGTKNPLDFSFSGIKTAVLYYVQSTEYRVQSTEIGRKRQNADIAASFQETVIDALVKKSLIACELKKTPRLAVGGGVAANNRLREKLYQASSERGITCYFPPKEFCMDNAAMVAGLGYRLFRYRPMSR